MISQHILSRGIGIEYTRVPNKIHDENRTFFTGLYNKVSDLQKEHALRAGFDGAALEIASPVMKSIDEINAFKVRVDAFFADLSKITRRKWLPHTEAVNPATKVLEYIDGGGEHVHISADFFNGLLRDFIRHPVIFWFMSDWTEVDASPRTLVKAFLDTYKEENISFSNLMRFVSTFSNGWGQTPIQDRRLSSVYSPFLKETYNTAEVRFLRASEDTEHLLDNISLISELAVNSPYIDGLHVTLNVTPNYLQDYDAYAAAAARVHIADFKRIIEDVGLDWNRYSRHVSNYLIRRKYGKLD